MYCTACTFSTRRRCTAIRRGMSAIVPVQLLLLFTWQEVVLQACGLRGAEFLKANTGRVAGARLSKYSSASHGSERARFTSYWIQSVLCMRALSRCTARKLWQWEPELCLSYAGGTASNTVARQASTFPAVR